MRKNNRGQVSLSTAPTLIITLVIIGIVAGLGLTVLADLRTTQREGASIVNESLGVVTALTPIALANGDVSTGTIELWVNRSGTIDMLILGQNYTATSSANTAFVTVNDTKYSGKNNRSWINYSYFQHPADYNGTVNAIESITNFTDLMPVIGLVVAIVIVLGVLFLLFRPGSRGGL